MLERASNQFDLKKDDPALHYSASHLFDVCLKEADHAAPYLREISRLTKELKGNSHEDDSSYIKRQKGKRKRKPEDSSEKSTKRKKDFTGSRVLGF